MQMKTYDILFMMAHLDDEIFGPWGTIRKYARSEGCNVAIAYVACNDEDDEETERRLNAIDVISKDLGITVFHGDGKNLEITRKYATEFINHVIDRWKPNIVFTHSDKDLHHDHKLVSEVTSVAARPHPNSKIQYLYHFESIPSTRYGGGFNPNHYEVIDFSEEEQDLFANHYVQYQKNYEMNDARSFGSLLMTKSMHGSTVGEQAAEAFELKLSFQ